MNEEEKKAIKYFYNLRATIDESNMLFEEDINVKCGKETIRQITIILNLIEKLQKENEELEEINNELEAEKNEAIRRYNFETIPKQKVKDKIEELKNISNAEELEDIMNRKNHTISELVQYVLQELLEGRKI